jgi:hypothetical protein
MKLAWSVTLAASLAASATGAIAQETTTYSYDALGRLRTVTKAGGSASGVASTYDYDAAGNRTAATVSNASASSGSSGSGSGGSNPGDGAAIPGGISTPKYVIIPLNGYTLIRIN